MNPYDWQSHHPQIEILRPALAKVVKRLGRGGSAVVLGGRGMGRSRRGPRPARLAYTEGDRGETVRIISLRKANSHERAKYWKALAH